MIVFIEFYWLTGRICNVLLIGVDSTRVIRLRLSLFTCKVFERWAVFTVILLLFPLMLTHELLAVDFGYVDAENPIVPLEFFFDRVAHFRNLLNVWPQDRRLVLPFKILRFQLIFKIVTFGILLRERRDKLLFKIIVVLGLVYYAEHFVVLHGPFVDVANYLIQLDLVESR